MSHQAHGDDPSPYPGGDLTPATIVLLVLAVLGAFVWYGCVS